MNESTGSRETPGQERDIRRLSDQSGIDINRVRSLFSHERTRLGMGAKVGSYLAVLTTANVRGMLRRAARQAEGLRVGRATSAARDANRAATIAGTGQPVHRWEDDGGRAAESTGRAAATPL